MRYIFDPPVATSTVSLGDRVVAKGDTVELDEAAAARILRSSGAECLLPAEAKPAEAKPAARKKPAAKSPEPVAPVESSDESEPEGEGA